VTTDLDTLLQYFEYGESDRALLARLGPVLEKSADALVASFYRHLLSFPETRHHLRDPEVTQRLLGMQRRYLLSLAGPRIDAAYVENRRRIGAVHERIGVGPGWYLGAYGLYVSLLTPLVCEDADGDLERAEQTLVALNRLLLFDAHLAMEAYIEGHEHDLEYLNQQLVSSGRQLAESLERSDAALRRTTERAKAAERLASLGTLVAGLAHEIGTPMGVIQGHAKLLESKVTDENAAWRLRTIQGQISRISRIIQSLLNMARPSRASRLAVSIEPLLESTLAFLTEKLARRQIKTRTDFASVPSVLGDPERLQQLFLNLFLNAADAMADGGELCVATRVVAEGDAAGDVEIRVTDTGPGIPEDEVAHIFDPFFTTKAAGEGNGLGLAVAHGIVAEHHGLIEVARTDASGTEFRILLPAPPAESSTSRPPEL
jgi:signal transduction histidine kinase